MPEYQYFGVDRDGKRQQGKMVAANEGDLRMLLRSQGVRPTKISKMGGVLGEVKGFIKGANRKVSAESLLTFTRQLHVLITSGIPLVQALDILSEQAIAREMKDIIVSLRERVSQGAYLWQALSSFPKTFPRMYVALIRAGEASGSMDSMLKRLGKYMEDGYKLQKMLKSAMMYPIMVVLLGMVVIIGMLVFVIPKFKEMLTASGQELPGPTVFLLNLSSLVIDNLTIILIGLVVSGYLTLQFFRSPEGKAFSQRVFFSSPVFGPLMQKSGVARFARTLATLLGAGVNLLDAVDICRTTVDNAVIEDATAKIRSAVEAGKTLGAVMGKISVFPKMATQMIIVGESTGHLEGMLERVAEFYESEVETLISGLTKLIEPLILVFLGGTVGGILIAMYLPVFKLAGGASNQ